MKKKILLVTILSTLSAYSTQFNVVVDKERNEYDVSIWYPSTITSDWAYSGEYGCETPIPLTTEYNEGIVFEQTEKCYEDKTRIHQDIETNSITGEVRYVGEPYSETVTEDVIHEYDAVGTYRGTKCLDILNKGEHHGSGNYLLSDGNTVYCEMVAGGGGFQLKSTTEYIPDGNLSDGTHVNTEAGSNPTNTIINIQNPVSNYAIMQPAGSDEVNRVTEYEVHPTTCSNISANDWVALTLWTDVETSYLFHNRTYYADGSFRADGFTASIIDTQEVNGKMWYKFRYMQRFDKAPKLINPINNYEYDSCHNWYIGYGVNKAVNQHFTGISYQIYTK